ncbi:hypothetical protein DRO37_08635 [Candidatus Bathyarchaeota archaeon]|nr:MAG: hypothetical protein DRO37_08635 [Candidatus Bathyarchaeota archaeon]
MLSFTGEFKVENVTPCISRLISDVEAGRNVSYLGRYTLASFLLKSGQGLAEVAETFKSLPDLDDALTLYQAEHIAECGGRPPSCEALKKSGIKPRSKRLLQASTR